MNVTSINQLAKYARGQVVELPPFADDQPFVARIKRPSMLALVKAGRIPNSLLTTANSLFAGRGINTGNLEALPELFGVLDVLCDACFVEPTYSQLKEAGVELTDDQLMFIFTYTQQGVKALEPFRKQSKSNRAAGNVDKVSKDTV